MSSLRMTAKGSSLTKGFAHENRMPQTERISLPYICYLDLAEPVELLHEFLLSAFFEFLFQFEGVIEVVFDALFYVSL